MKCPQCGAPIDPNAVECKFCGEKIAAMQIVTQQPVTQQPMMQPQFGMRTNPYLPIKNKTVAAVLAIILGDFGAHKFYLGQTGMGIAYLLFCWTYIPGIVGLIEGIMYLLQSDEEFSAKHNVRVG